MTDTTYYPQVRCEVSGGIRDDGADVTVCVVDERGNEQYLQVAKGLVNEESGVSYLPVGFIRLDRENRRVLVELPYEADSGVNRLWMKFDSLRREEKALA